MSTPWEVVIGLETHVQLSTNSKIFSGSSTTFGAPPNTQANTFDVALPGVLPVLNKGVVERAIKFGLAVGATIAPRSIFARKNYFYPDLPKGYQISQFEHPIVIGGSVTIVTPTGEKRVNLTRAHMEEDAGKSLHEGIEAQGVTGIDLNRAGTPLLEVVTEPEMRSAQEAVAYAKALHSLVTYLDICDGNLQEGSFRCDANVSVRPLGTEKFGTRVEIKNINSFRFLEKAIEHEIHRQIELIEDGGRIVQETRLYDSEKNETRSMRSKEDAMDYRYFPDPDLLPIAISEDWIARVKATLPELPDAKRDRFVAELSLSAYDAQVLTSSRDTANYFETVVNTIGVTDKNEHLTTHAKIAANWVMGDLSALLNERDLPASKSPISALQLAGIIVRITDGTISNKIGKSIFDAIISGTAHSADEVIERDGLKQISDSGALEAIIDDILAANAGQVADFKSGKEKAFNSLIGMAMKASKGKANPTQLSELLRKKLS
jgi:aspartyl-tRNA(Asn)/glutamyl-tRNA(Gln) amidotransferase subunit B